MRRPFCLPLASDSIRHFLTWLKQIESFLAKKASDCKPDMQLTNNIKNCLLTHIYFSGKLVLQTTEI
jgi:hypothetical protein